MNHKGDEGSQRGIPLRFNAIQNFVAHPFRVDKAHAKEILFPSL